MDPPRATRTPVWEEGKTCQEDWGDTTIIMKATEEVAIDAKGGSICSSSSNSSSRVKSKKMRTMTRRESRQLTIEAAGAVTMRRIRSVTCTRDVGTITTTEKAIATITTATTMTITITTMRTTTPKTTIAITTKFLARVDTAEPLPVHANRDPIIIRESLLPTTLPTLAPTIIRIIETEKGEVPADNRSAIAPAGGKLTREASQITIIISRIPAINTGKDSTQNPLRVLVAVADVEITTIVGGLKKRKGRRKILKTTTIMMIRNMLPIKTKRHLYSKNNNSNKKTTSAKALMLKL